MKIFQVLNGFCHWDATPFVPSLEKAAKMYAPDIKFVEAPNYVFEGWGFDETKEGDECFIKPTAPEGYIYDESRGVYRPAEEFAEPKDIWDELAEAYSEGVNEA